MLTVVAAAMTLFYLSAIPVHIALSLRIGDSSLFSLGFSLFEPRFALRRMRPLNAAFKPSDALRPTDALRAIRSALKHIRLDRLQLEGTLGTSDAALTALLCGGVSSVGCALCCAGGQRIRIGLRPDFTVNRLHADLEGMISIRAGHIMIAALVGALEFGSRRLKEWTSIPLKAL